MTKAITQASKFVDATKEQQNQGSPEWTIEEYTGLPPIALTFTDDSKAIKVGDEWIIDSDL